MVKGQADSAVYVEAMGSGANQSLVVQWNDASFYPSRAAGVVTFEAILNENGTIFFNYKNLNSGDAGAGGAGATVGIKGAGSQSTGGNVLLVSYTSATSPFVASNSSLEVGTGLSTTDYYSFSATAGQTVTLTAATSAGQPVQLSLENSSGTTLGTGTTLATDVNSVVRNFTIPATGTYYAAINGMSGTGYSLVVTRNADFDTKTGTSMATAQNISGTGGVLGSIQAATPQDWYSVALAAEADLSLQVATLGSTTSQFVDTLNPHIQLFSPGGTLLATGSAGQPINQVAAAAGTYTIEVTGVSGTVGEYYLSQNIAVAPPQIAAVYVSGGAAWSTAFYQYLTSQGLGSSLGFAVPGGKNQLQILPWNDLTTVSVVFTQNVTVNTAAAGLALVGSADLPAVASLNSATFQYNSATDTATWTFASPLATDKYLLCIPSAAVMNSSGTALDGDWTNPVGGATGSSFPSGNGSAGGDFDFRFNVVQGDVNRDSVVTGLDGTTVRLHLGQTTASPGYSIYSDVDGDGTIASSDIADVRAALLQRLPAAEPTPPGGQQHQTAVPTASLPNSSASSASLVSSSPPVSSSSAATPSKSPASPSTPGKQVVASTPAVVSSKGSEGGSGKSRSPDRKSSGRTAAASLHAAPIIFSPATKPLAAAATSKSPIDPAAALDPTIAIRDALFEHLDRIASRKRARADS